MFSGGKRIEEKAKYQENRKKESKWEMRDAEGIDEVADIEVALSDGETKVNKLDVVI